jgi:hypothetical protein
MASYRIEPPTGLADRIMESIRYKQRVIAFKKTALFSFTFLASLIAVMPAFSWLHSDIANSGFLSFSSLIFSDFSIVVRYWQSFGMTILETLPALSIALFLIVLAILMESAILMAKNTKLILKT